MPNFENPVQSEQEPVSGREILRKAHLSLMAEAMRSPEGIKGIKAWRELDKNGPATSFLRRLCDSLSALDTLRVRGGEEFNLARDELSARLTEISQNKSRIAELGQLLFFHFLKIEPPQTPSETKFFFDSLLVASSSEGQVDVAGLLSSARVSFGDKEKWFSQQFLSAVKFLERKDKLEAVSRAVSPPQKEIFEQKLRIPTFLPPPASRTFAPSMEELTSAKEGEPGGWFTVAPFFGGYYRECVFDIWDQQSLEWKQKEAKVSSSPDRDVDEGEKDTLVISGIVGSSSQTYLPIPYGFCPLGKRISISGSANSAKLEIFEDNNDDIILDNKDNQMTHFSVPLIRLKKPREKTEASVLNIKGRLSEKTEAKIKETVAGEKSLFDKARELKRYVRGLLRYSNDSSMNDVYRSGNSGDYFLRLEEHKKADCDVANTFFAALLSRAGIPCRLVAGHYVKTKNRFGAAVLSSGTAHAWVEIFDENRWRKLDATPPGDPNMDQDETDEAGEEMLRGDFGEDDSISEEELRRMIEEAKKRLAEEEKIPEKLTARYFAEAAGCSEEEAKTILKEIKEARELTDRKGRKIGALLVSEFQKICRENMRQRLEYRAPVRMSDSDTLHDPVEAWLDITRGESDPGGFGRHERKVALEQIYGGFDLVLVADKSGSMGFSMGESGISKATEQQRIIFLVFDALSKAADEFRRNKIQLISPINVRFGLVSFRAGEATIEFPLGFLWGPKEQFQVWKALGENIGGGTPDHLGMQAAGEMLPEELPKKASGGKRVQIVLEYSDGVSDEAEKFAEAIARLENRDITVAAYREDIKQFPGFVSEKIVIAVKKLYPQKVLGKTRRR